MPRDTTLLLNDFGLLERATTTKSGDVRRRYTVQVEAQTLMLNLDPRAVGKGIATAIATLYRERITAIAAPIAAATKQARKVAAKAFAAGKPWAMRRYAGGRTGQMAPAADGGTLFNDSGRLAATIVAGATGDGYVVNVAANRLNGNTLDNGGTSALLRIFDRLVQYVPELGNPALLMDNIGVRRARDEAVAQMTKKLDRALTGSALDVAKELAGLASDVDATIERFADVDADAG